MAHEFLVKQIAQQAGVSLATVDRVLNKRSGVRTHTRERVEQALAELDQQRRIVGLQGRSFTFDLVMEAPSRFSRTVTLAIESILPSLQPAVVRVRYHLAEQWDDGGLESTLVNIAKKGSQGVLLKAPSVEKVAQVSRLLLAQGVPVVTLVTDQPEDARNAYIGLDNCKAGATAAYLIDNWLRDKPIRVLLSISGANFQGELERARGFRQTIKKRRPDASIFLIDQGKGLDTETTVLVRKALQENGGFNAIYSMGGANRAILSELERYKVHADVFIAHDLDDENRELLSHHELSAVLHHDLILDLRYACEQILRQHKIQLPHAMNSPQSIQIITPYNLN